MTSALLQSTVLGRTASAATSLIQRSRSSPVTVFARERPFQWYPRTKVAEHLDGTTPGDFGFDPLGLAKNKDAFNWYKEGEITNARWAMLAVAGILFTDAEKIAQPWWDLSNKALLPVSVLVVLFFAIFPIAEAARFRNFQKFGGGESGLLNQVPFDPVGFLPNDYFRESEVRNGRLAMIAFLGFASQAAVQGKGPWESLQYHLDDPFHHNIFTSKVGNEVTVAIVVLSFWPLLIEATKNTKGQDKVRI